MALGHTRIGIVSGPMDVASMRARVDGAASALGDRLAFQVASSFSMELEHEVHEAVVSRRATAIFAGTDLLALGVIRAAQTAGLNVPADLAVIGFGDMPSAQMANPPLSSIEMPLEDMAAEAVDALLRRIDGAAAETAADVVFGTTLIVRASTAEGPLASL